MLQVTDIRDNKEKYVQALAKRGLDAASILEEVLSVDEERRSSQAKLDEVLAQSNSYSKEIGQLFKQGEIEKANALKEETVALKENSKKLNEQMLAATEQLQQLLYTLPNIPHSSVPSGTDENDNEEVYKEGDIPK